MKITQKRLNTVIEGMLVKFGVQNILEPYDNIGDVAGVALNCREQSIQIPDTEETETVLICELVIDGACNVLMSSPVPSLGGSFGAGAQGTATLGVTPSLGVILPRSWSDTSEYPAGLIPALICVSRM